MEAIYKLRQRPGAEEFRAAWDLAIDRGVARVEDCALARAIEGEERMVVSSGKLIGTEIRHNEALVMFFLRNRRAARYGPQALVEGHPDYEALKDEIERKVRAEHRAEHHSPEKHAWVKEQLDLLKARWRAEWENEQRLK